jgi:Zn-dependent alcohol dehydrogenase
VLVQAVKVISGWLVQVGAAGAVGPVAVFGAAWAMAGKILAMAISAATANVASRRRRPRQLGAKSSIEQPPHLVLVRAI